MPDNPALLCMDKKHGTERYYGYFKSKRTKKILQ